jgi:hypothetical protein
MSSDWGGPLWSSGRPARHRREAAKLFIIAGRCGRLANRLVLFANFIAFAEEEGHRVANVTFHSYAELFVATRRDIYCRYPAARRGSWLDVIPGVAGAIRWTRLFAHGVRMVGQINERLPILGSGAITFRQGPSGYVSLEGPEVRARVRDAKRVFIFGWTFRAPRYLQRHAEKIRAYFRPIEKHDRAAREAVEKLRRNSDVVVGIHIRHGDYRNWRGGKYFFPVERYTAWAKELAEQFQGRKVSFLVCSDEPRHQGEFQGLSVGFGTGHPVEDICALSECDYVIGPVSTFTQWASFYGNKPLFHLRDTKSRIERDQFQVSYLEEIPQ